MRSVIVIATGIGVGVLTLIGARLADSIGNVRTIASSLPPSPATAGDAHPGTATRLETAIAGFASTPTDTEELAPPAEAAVTTLGDEQILSWLAANPELQRAAEELLRDPDAEVRRDARDFLRELGVAVPAGEGEH